MVYSVTVLESDSEINLKSLRSPYSVDFCPNFVSHCFKTIWSGYLEYLLDILWNNLGNTF